MAVRGALGLSGTLVLERSTIAQVDLTGSMDQLAPSGCVLLECDFSGATLERRIQPVFRARRRNVFRRCRFDGADLRGVDLGGTRFEECTFDGARLDGWITRTAEFVDCRFSGRVAHVRFYGRAWGPTASKIDPPRATNEFRGNDLSGADLVDFACLMGVDVAAQRWPESEEYLRLDRVHMRLTRSRSEILRWKHLAERAEALKMVHGLSALYVQQDEIFARRIDPGSTFSPEIQRRVWETLLRAV